MNIVNRVELKLEKFEKCSFSCDGDCSLGYIYDYACSLMAFSLKKMKDADEAIKASQSSPVQIEEQKEV